jgi:hypothetical protein
MRRISSCFILFFCFLYPSLALADPWDQFQEFNDAYYFLDDHIFESFTCTVTLPTVQTMVKEIQKQINSDGQKHLIRQNLSDFRLTFHRSGELKFVKPSLSVDVERTDEADEESRANMELGVKMIEDGFQATIRSVAITLESLFSSYIRPKRELYRIESFQRNGGKADIRYEFDGILLDASCYGSQCSRSGSTSNADIEISEDYISIGGKWVMKDYRGLIKHPEQTMETTLAVSYQKVRKLYVPREIKGKTTVTQATGSPSNLNYIVLEDCKVE